MDNVKKNTLYKRLMLEGYQEAIDKRETIICRTDKKVVPAELIFHT